MKKSSYTLQELSKASGVSPRTIRFYIARNVLAAPVQAGRHASYDAGHLERLEEIKRLKDQGQTLAEIAISDREPEPLPEVVPQRRVVPQPGEAFTRLEVSCERLDANLQGRDVSPNPDDLDTSPDQSARKPVADIATPGDHHALHAVPPHSDSIASRRAEGSSSASRAAAA